MNDSEFIELLNLYVDREIDPEDALRLEAAVDASPRRRSIYNQYCRIQKACTMLSKEIASSEARADSGVLAFPSWHRWRAGPLLGGLAAAAACFLVAVVVQNHGNGGFRAAPDSFQPRPLTYAPDLMRPADTMTPVFTVFPAIQPARQAQGLMFAEAGPQSQAGQLDWIGDIHLAPVDTGLNADYLLGRTTGTRATALSGPQVDRGAPEPTETAAFRFQR